MLSRLHFYSKKGRRKCRRLSVDDSDICPYGQVMLLAMMFLLRKSDVFGALHQT